MTIFKDAPESSVFGIVREYNVLHIAAELKSDDGNIDRARTEILKWAQRRSGTKLPADAMAGRSFEILNAGRNSSAVEVDLPDIYAWALRQEDPDKVVAGRIWTSEAILWRAPNRLPQLAARLMVVSRESELDIAPAAPGYIRQIVDNIGLESAGRPLHSAPWYIGDRADQDALVELLGDPDRRLPVVVFSAVNRANPQLTINVKALAEGLCGLADVAVILPDTSWALTERFGKRLSVFDRAVRIYMPGFDDDADPFVHPLWLGARLVTEEVAAVVDRQIRFFIAQFSTRAIRLGNDIPAFAQWRSFSRKTELDRLVSGGASNKKQLFAANDRIKALEEERDEARKEAQNWTNETEAALLRAEEAERREHNATVQVQNLLQKLADAGGGADDTNNLPTRWADFDEWCDSALCGLVALTGVARRGCKKAQYSDVAQAARCLRWLGHVCRERLLAGGGPLQDEIVEEGIRNSTCGTDEFPFDWQGQRLKATWHVKTGGNTRAPENCLRIYYCLDHQTQQIIVADMPGHRRTGAS